MEQNTAQKSIDEDLWEIVSGSKSLSTETVQSLLQSMEGEGLPEKERAKGEDWYTTLPPATPANTPEYTPTPPTYPSSTMRKDVASTEGGELFPIQEDMVEEPVSERGESSDLSAIGGDSFLLEYTPADSESESQAANTTLRTIEYWAYRIAAYLIVFGIVKWLVSKVWTMFRGQRNVVESK